MLFELKVPAGTEMGARFRLAGKGAPWIRDAAKAGDLYVTVEAKY